MGDDRWLVLVLGLVLSLSACANRTGTASSPATPVGESLLRDLIPLIRYANGNPLTTPVVGQSLLHNGGFELALSVAEGEEADGDGGLPGWTINNWGGSSQRQGLDSQERHGGSQAWRIEKTSQEGAAACWQDVAVAGGAEYRWQLYVKGDAGMVIVAYFDDQGQRDEKRDLYVPTPPSTVWQKVEVHSKAPPGAVSARLWLAVYYQIGVVWFDDVAVFREDE